MTELELRRFKQAQRWLADHPVPANNSTDRALWDDAWLIFNRSPSEWPPLVITKEGEE